MELRPLSKNGLETALEKAEHYRLLNEAQEAESICLDVLQLDPDNPRAMVTLILAVTDQFGRAVGATVSRAEELIDHLKSEYERVYYSGIICERWAKAQIRQGTPGSGENAYHWLQKAFDWYEKAIALQPAGTEDAVLRWNTCVRIMERHHHVQPETDDGSQPFLE
ncbi:MAG: hypothetical protein O7F16_08770 [Acidobacteria bacterium]|nr:hypothetical protein [Acidobacteriota bacterium]